MFLGWRVWAVVALVNVLVVAALVIVTAVNHTRIDRTIVARKLAFPRCVMRVRRAARKRAREHAQRHGLSVRATRARMRRAARNADIQAPCGWKYLQSREVEHILGSSGLFVLLLGLDLMVYLDQRPQDAPPSGAEAGENQPLT